MNNVKLTPNGEYYELTEDYTFMGVTVPKGFKTDGISYKLKIFALRINKFDPRYINAVVMHDYLCEQQKYKLADTLFKAMLPNNYIGRNMVRAVKIYHWIMYGVK